MVEIGIDAGEGEDEKGHQQKGAKKAGDDLFSHLSRCERRAPEQQGAAQRQCDDDPEQQVAKCKLVHNADSCRIGYWLTASGRVIQPAFGSSSTLVTNSRTTGATTAISSRPDGTTCATAASQASNRKAAVRRFR